VLSDMEIQACGTFVADVGVLQTGVPDADGGSKHRQERHKAGESAFLRCQVDTFRAGEPGPPNCLQKNRGTTASNWRQLNRTGYNY
jgi:hypothetical protein